MISICIFWAICIMCLVVIVITLISIFKQEDERGEMIIRKTSKNTLIIMFGYIFISAIEQSMKVLNEGVAKGINPFVQLSILSIVYLIQLIYYKRRYGG